MKQTNEKSEQIDKMMESYYSYVGYCHIENIVKELDEKKDEINRIEIPSSMDEWFNKFSKKHRRKNKLKRVIDYTQKISKKMKKLLEEFAKEEKLAKKRKGFFKKIFGKF